MKEKNLETTINSVGDATQIREKMVSKNETNNSKFTVDEEKEKVNNVKDDESKIKESIQKRLHEKIRESEFWTEEQLSKVSNIEESQVKMTADYIYNMGKNRLSKNEESNEKEYYKKLRKKCADITENEAKVNPNFNIDAAIKKEQEIKEKIETGELTLEEAQKAYYEPISEIGGGILNSLQKYGVKTYEDIYKEMTSKEQSKDKSKLFRESLTKGAPSLEKQCANSKIFQEKEANIINNNKVKKHNELTK